MMDKLHNQMIAAGLPITGIYDAGNGEICYHGPELTTEQQTTYNQLVADWQVNAPKDALKSEMAAAVERYLDQSVAVRGYASCERCATYANSTVPAWKADAEAAIAWRDSVWVSAYEIMDEVENGIIPVPTADELIAMLPVLGW